MMVTLALCGTSKTALIRVENDFIQFSQEIGIELHTEIYTNFSCLNQDLRKFDIVVIEEDTFYSKLADITSLIESKKHRYDDPEVSIIIQITRFPMRLREFVEMVSKLPKRDDTLNIPIAKGFKTEYVNNVIFFENKDRRIHIKTVNGLYQTDMSMKETLELMRPYPFASPYVSFLVNLDWVEQIKGRDVVLKSGGIVPLSQKKAAIFRQVFRVHMSKTQ